MNQFSFVRHCAPATILRRATYETEHQTAVVLGIPQGGTSMLAAVVDALGVPMTGGALFNFERSEGRPSFSDDTNEWRNSVRTWNAKADRWGFKDTTLWRFVASIVQSELRNPFYLAAVRDVAATAQRRAADAGIVDEGSLTAMTITAVQQSIALWEFLGDLQIGPLLIVSYERALRHPLELCDQVAEFLGLQPTDRQRRRAVARISAAGGYLVSESIDNA